MEACAGGFAGVIESCTDLKGAFGSWNMISAGVQKCLHFKKRSSDMFGHCTTKHVTGFHRFPCYTQLYTKNPSKHLVCRFVIVYGRQLTQDGILHTPAQLILLPSGSA